jgi:hypothetical protein
MVIKSFTLLIIYEISEISHTKKFLSIWLLTINLYGHLLSVGEWVVFGCIIIYYQASYNSSNILFSISFNLCQQWILIILIGFLFAYQTGNDR